MRDQLGRTETYAYDFNDNLIRMTDRKGQITNYGYDKFDRISRADYADASYTTYAYDAVDHWLWGRTKVSPWSCQSISKKWREFGS
jgi:YD repeat-containing protein